MAIRWRSTACVRMEHRTLAVFCMRRHAASVLMAEELDLGADGRLELGEDGLNFTGAELTVREFMEEQQQKRNGLIHGDSDHIAVEGHIGTWYAIDETEVGGEKFFLLEHEEHGDMAACVAVNEQGKLVAEDLWNGFDEDFQEAVQKYFSEKWNIPSIIKVHRDFLLGRTNVTCRKSSGMWQKIHIQPSLQGMILKRCRRF